MTRTIPSRPDQRWQEILRRAAIALNGRGVGVWEADARGRLQLLAASSAEDRALVAGAELELALRDLGELPTASRTPHRWVASRLKRGWCIAPVRSEPPLPPAGVERRGPERLTLELAGVCIGLIDEVDRRATASRDAESQALTHARRNQLELEDFVESAPVGIRWTAPDGTILRANPAELDMLGYGPDEYVGRNIAEFHLDPEVAADTLRRLRAGEALRSVEIRMRHRNGSICYGLLSANARFEGGQFIHARCVTRDITERKRAEQALVHFKCHGRVCRGSRRRQDAGG